MDYKQGPDGPVNENTEIRIYWDRDQNMWEQTAIFAISWFPLAENVLILFCVYLFSHSET